LKIGGIKSIGMGKFSIENAIVREFTSKENFLFLEIKVNKIK